MSARESAEARLARAAEGRNRGPGGPVRRASEQRTKSVRMTVDMPPAMHRRLKSWTGFAAGHLDVADVPAAHVVRVLVEMLTAGPEGEDAEFSRELVRRVLAELRRRQDEQ